jgi:hypothetical protein
MWPVVSELCLDQIYYVQKDHWTPREGEMVRYTCRGRETDGPGKGRDVGWLKKVGRWREGVEAEERRRWWK